MIRGLAMCLGVLIGSICTGAAAEVRKIYTVNYPLQFFAQRIAGAHALVVFPAPAGLDPAHWKPSIEAIAEYQKADLILLNGAHYAGWTGAISLPRGRLVDTSKAFADRYIAIEDVITHSHGPRGAHSHTGIASYTWLDFQQAAQQAEAIGNALKRKWPARRLIFERNLKALTEELKALDRQLKDLVARRPEQLLLASHPLYQYLARRYGLRLQSLQWEPRQMPDDGQWRMLEKRLKEFPAQWMLWEAEPMAQSANRLAEIGVRSIVFDPCANVPAQGDWLSVMRQNIENLQAAF